MKTRLDEEEQLDRKSKWSLIYLSGEKKVVDDDLKTAVIVGEKFNRFRLVSSSRTQIVNLGRGDRWAILKIA